MENTDKKDQKSQSKDLALKAAQIALDCNSTDVVAIDLMGKSPATDYFVIATGTSNRQIRTVADEIIVEAKKRNFQLFGKAGYEEGRWILLDFVTVVIHIFDEEYRSYYDLEMLWGDAKRMELEGLMTDESSN